MQAWCLVEESENEQWQEVISKQNKRLVKKVNHASLLSMENSHNSNPKKVVEVKGQMGESQSHHGLWSRWSCHA